MKLYASLGSSFARKIRVMLIEKGVPHELEMVNLWEPNDLKKTIIVSKDSSGVIKINQQVYQTGELGPALLEIFRTRNERVMFVNASPELLYNEVVEIIDIAKGSGVDKIGLMTEQLAPAPK